jgi:hypothetical protein
MQTLEPYSARRQGALWAEERSRNGDHSSQQGVKNPDSTAKLFANTGLTCKVRPADGLAGEMRMSSPVDDMTDTTANRGLEPGMVKAQEASYGADEERLVQLAQQEAVLRLARAM